MPATTSMSSMPLSSSAKRSSPHSVEDEEQAMRTMTAYRLTRYQQPPEFVDIPVPEPGPGEVRVKVAGVGLCHSDLLFLDSPEGAFPYTLPFTLGHEIAGWV